MKAELKRLHSPDIDDLAAFHPKQDDCFAFLLQLMVGVKGKEGEESFDVFVCTPKWLLENHKDDDVLFGLHNIIVFRYDYAFIVEKLKSYIEKIEAENWEELASKINLIGKWEFHNYRR